MRTKYLNRVTESSFIRWYFDDDKDFFAKFGNTVALEIQKTDKILNGFPIAKLNKL